MSYHSFCGGKESATLHAVLKTSKFHEKITDNDWRSILLDGISALNYLYHQKILHNDIKCDNLVIEYLPPEYTSCRCVLIDFGKACFVSDAMRYKLSEKKRKYIKIIIHRLLQKFTMDWKNNHILVIFMLLVVLFIELMEKG